MKKLIMICIALSVLLVSFVSCAGNSLPEGYVEITALNNNSDLINSFQMTDESGEHFDSRWKFLEDKFKIKFTYVASSYTSWPDRTRTLIATNDLPDVALANLSLAEYKHYADQGQIKLLPADLLEKYPNIAKNINSVTAKEGLQKDGQYFAIPRSLDMEGVSSDYTYMFLYRTDWARAAGVTIKDAYTIAEMYDMFAKVKAKYPDKNIYSSIEPKNILLLGMYQYIDNFGVKPNSNFQMNDAGNAYEYVPSKPGAVEGIKWMKKFYDAGFVKPDFISYPAYEARSDFQNDKLFAYWDGADLQFFNSLKTGFKGSNPELNPDECVGAALVLNSDNKYMIKDDGNFWSTIIFNAKISDEKLHRYLEMYDYLCSEEGMNLRQFGIEGEHYKIENGEMKILREYNEDTKIYVAFNSKLPDTYMVMQEGPILGVSRSINDPILLQSSKDVVGRLFEARLASPHIMRPFNVKLNMYDSNIFGKFNINAFDEANNILITKKANEVEAAWSSFLSANQTAINQVIDELNSNLLK